MTAKGTSDIISTAESVEKVPVAYSSLLDQEYIDRVKEMSLSNLHTGSTDTPTLCTTCPTTITLKVQAAMKYSDTVSRPSNSLSTITHVETRER